MIYDKELAIQRLNEFKIIFNKFSSNFDWFIDRLKNSEYNEDIYKELKEFMHQYVFPKLVFSGDRDPIKEKICNLGYSVSSFIRNKNRVIFDKDMNQFKLIPYPEKEFEEELNSTTSRVYDELLDSIFTQNVVIDSLIESRIKLYEECNNRFKNNVKKYGLKPYYGTIDYMLNRMKYILNCIDKILNSVFITNEYKKNFIKPRDEIAMLYLCTVDKLDEKVDFKDKYTMVEYAFSEILKIEDSTKKYMEPIWKSYLTNPTDYVEGMPYRFLMHCVSNGHVPEEKLTKLCTTLATDKCSPIPEYGNFGYIVDVDIDQISTMCPEDSGSWIITFEDFVDRNFPDTWQLFEKINDTSYVFYEVDTTSKLLLPWDIEKEMTERNMKYEGVTHGPNAYLYSEIFFRRTDKPIKVLGYFAMSKEGLAEITRINEQSDIKKPIIDLSYLYENVSENKKAI